jgi:hypothetical protein
MTEFKKRVALKAKPLLTPFLFILYSPLSTARATVSVDLRTEKRPDFVRLAMECDRPFLPPSFSVFHNRPRVDPDRSHRFGDTQTHAIP